MIAEVKGYLKSRVQGKMLRISRESNYVFWKVSDRQIMRICTNTSEKKMFNVQFSRPFDYIADFKSSKDGTKLCSLSRYGHLVIFIIEELNYKTITKKFFDRCKYHVYYHSQPSLH